MTEHLMRDFGATDEQIDRERRKLANAWPDYPQRTVYAQTVKATSLHGFF